MSYSFRVQKRIAHLLKMPVSELSNYINYFRKRSNKNAKNIVIFSQTRSGSTLLGDLLSSTGYFRCKGEIFDKKAREIRFPYLYISGLARASENVIFQVKIHHLTTARKNPVDCKEFFEKLYNDGWLIIFLDRKDKVGQVLSHTIAENRGKYHETRRFRKEIKLTIDCNLFKSRFHERILERKEELEILSNVNPFYINYENNLLVQENHQETVNQVLENLDLKPKPVSTKYKKINNSKPEDIIENYREFVEMVKSLGPTLEDYKFVQ